MGLLLVWEWTQPREGGRKRRLDDQLQFYAETMYRFNREIERYLREELGCKQLVNAGNWRTADAAKLDDAERWSYTANEVLAVNRYYSPVHIGPDRGWRIDPGDSFEDASVLLRPRELPLNLRQAVGHPMMMTESHWVPPLGYQSEGPFLVAAYQSLTGVDVFYWFSPARAEWSNQDRAPGTRLREPSGRSRTPMVLGQFPAAALLFRKHYLEEGEPVVEEHRSLREIWERVPPVLAEDPGYDPNRDSGDIARRSGMTGKSRPARVPGRSGESPLRLETRPVEGRRSRSIHRSQCARSSAATPARFASTTDEACARSTPRSPGGHWLSQDRRASGAEWRDNRFGERVCHRARCLARWRSPVQKPAACWCRSAPVLDRPAGSSARPHLRVTTASKRFMASKLSTRGGCPGRSRIQKSR